MSERSPRHRLFDILNSIHHIESIVVGLDQEGFTSDHLRYRAVERELEIISEASCVLSDAESALSQYSVAAHCGHRQRASPSL